MVLPPENTKPIEPNPVLLITHDLPGSGDEILPQEVGTLTAGLEPYEWSKEALGGCLAFLLLLAIICSCNT